MPNQSVLPVWLLQDNTLHLVMPRLTLGPSSIDDAANGLRRAVLGLNLAILLSGMILVGLGAKINQHLSLVFEEGADLPRLWLIGILPVLLGVYGVVSIIAISRKLIYSWICLSVATLPLSYTYFTFKGHLEPERYGVNIQIFGHCYNEGRLCKCSWDHERHHGFMPMGSCDSIKLTTSLYLSLLGNLVLCFVLFLTALVLVSVYCCCLHKCLPGDELELHSAVHGAKIRHRPPDAVCYAPVLLEGSFLSPRHAITGRQQGQNQQGRMLLGPNIDLHDLNTDTSWDVLPLDLISHTTVAQREDGSSSNSSDGEPLKEFE